MNGQIDYDEPVGTWIKRTLAAYPMSQAELSRRMDVSTGMVAMWANGHRKPSPENAARMAAVLGVPTQEVMMRLGYAPRRAPEMNPKRAELMEAVKDLPPGELELVTGFVRWRTAEALRPRPQREGTPGQKGDGNTNDSSPS